MILSKVINLEKINFKFEMYIIKKKIKETEQNKLLDTVNIYSTNIMVEPRIKSIFDVEDIIKIIIRSRVVDLLKTIHNKYPVKFSSENINIELECILNNIKYQQKQIIQSKPKLNTLSNKTISSIPKEARCNARVWNNIYDKNTNCEVNEIDKKFIIKDFNDFHIKDFISRYTIGRQCSRKKTNDSNYCFQHSRHNPHGDYFKEPPNELCYHYMKDGYYLK